MVERAVLEPISLKEQWQVTAYLVAISPDLQKSVQSKRQQEMARPAPETVRKPPAAAATPAPAKAAPAVPPAAAPTDLGAAKAVFESACGGCHAVSHVEKSPPKSEADARSLIARMVDNGFFVDDKKLEQIVLYLAKTYGK
jgi:cytochrome c5